MAEEQKNTADLAPPKSTFDKIKDDTKEMVNKLLGFFRQDKTEDNLTVKSPTNKILKGIHKLLVEQEANRKEDFKNDRKSEKQEEREVERRHQQVLKVLLGIPTPTAPQVEIKQKEEGEKTTVKVTPKKPTKGRKPTAKKAKPTTKKVKPKTTTKPKAEKAPKTTPKPSASKSPVSSKVVAGGVAAAAVIGSSNAIAGVVESGPGYNVVKRPDGSVEKQIGDRNWRNNNPGNIEYGDFARSKGAIGSDGRFAIFPTYETGRKAKESLIFEGKNYRDLNLLDAVARYAPPQENNTAAYQKSVLSSVGQVKKMSEYNDAERTNILNAIEKQEGLRAGKIIALSKPTGDIQQASNNLGQKVESISSENKAMKAAATDRTPVNKVTNNVSMTEQNQTSTGKTKFVDDRSPMERVTHG